MLSGALISYIMVLITLQNNIINSDRLKNGTTRDSHGHRRTGFPYGWTRLTCDFHEWIACEC